MELRIKASNAAGIGPTGMPEAEPERNPAVREFRADPPCRPHNTQQDSPNRLSIKQAVDHLIGQLEAGKSEALTAYLSAMARFHSYSFGNILAIARQRPGARKVAGIHRWNELGRFVKKGEKGIRILAPMFRRRNPKDTGGVRRPEAANPQPSLMGFRAVSVFDVSQTEGAELPELELGVTGDVGRHRQSLMEFLARKNVALEFSEEIAPALGISYGGRIALLPGQSHAQEFVSLVHETAHELLHKAARRSVTTVAVRETEAEAVAFVVGQAIGLDMGKTSSDYIQLYDGSTELLTESLEVIQRTSAEILDGICPKQTGHSPADQFMCLWGDAQSKG
jgi:hypothetical protein